MGFLDDMKGSTPKSRVYLSITPGVGIELIQLDLTNNTVANYAMRELVYSESSRDIVDYENFKNAVESMYDELGVNHKSEVVVNMPIVSFGLSKFGLAVSNDVIEGALSNELETAYIFQKAEPLLDWISVPKSAESDGGEHLVAYSAIQKSVVDNLSLKLSEIGSRLVKVENSISSTFRALKYLGVASEAMQTGVTWNLLILSSIGYSLISMSGENIVDYFEEALPIKTLGEEELYDIITNSVQISLSSYPTNHLFVVSDTDLVSAAALVSRLNVMGTVDYIENNSYKTQDSIMPVSLNILQTYASKISLQAIGCALSDAITFPLTFNYTGKTDIVTGEASCTIPIGEHEFTINKTQALYLALAIGGAIFLFAALLYGVAIPLENSYKEKDNQITSKLDTAQKELKDMKGGEDLAGFDLNREVEMGVKGNRAKLMNYIAPGENIPEDVWLTYFMTQGNGLVDIKGEASDVSSVYTFFKNLRDSLNSTGSKLKLQKLEMVSKSVDAAVAGVGANYVFEITNMSQEELDSLENRGESEDNEEAPAPAENNERSSSSAPQESLIDDQPIE